MEGETNNEKKRINIKKKHEKKNEKIKRIKNNEKKTKNKRKKQTVKSAGVLSFGGGGLLIISGSWRIFLLGSILIQPEHYGLLILG